MRQDRHDGAGARKAGAGAHVQATGGGRKPQAAGASRRRRAQATGGRRKPQAAVGRAVPFEGPSRGAAHALGGTGGGRIKGERGAHASPQTAASMRAKSTGVRPREAPPLPRLRSGTLRRDQGRGQGGHQLGVTGSAQTSPPPPSPPSPTPPLPLGEALQAPLRGAACGRGGPRHRRDGGRDRPAKTAAERRPRGGDSCSGPPESGRCPALNAFSINCYRCSCPHRFTVLDLRSVPAPPLLWGRRAAATATPAGSEAEAWCCCRGSAARSSRSSST